MKKLLSIILIVVILALSLTACGGSPKVVEMTEDSVVITVSSKILKIEEGTTLSDYMNALKDKGELEFKEESGMVTEINGMVADSSKNEFWGLYTSDENNSNTAWGVVNFDEKEFGSATLGANDLKIKDGYIYIWSISSF